MDPILRELLEQPFSLILCKNAPINGVFFIFLGVLMPESGKPFDKEVILVYNGR
jgi:hypothetical protein